MNPHDITDEENNAGLLTWITTKFNLSSVPNPSATACW
jgi:hypothetical protein